MYGERERGGAERVGAVDAKRVRFFFSSTFLGWWADDNNSEAGRLGDGGLLADGISTRSLSKIPLIIIVCRCALLVASGRGD
jgi:hypothetical protein